MGSTGATAKKDATAAKRAKGAVLWKGETVARRCVETAARIPFKNTGRNAAAAPPKSINVVTKNEAKSGRKVKEAKGGMHQREAQYRQWNLWKRKMKMTKT